MTILPMKLSKTVH